MKQQKNSGFSIVELLLVIVIMGILMIIVTANIRNSGVTNRDKERAADMAILARHLEDWFESEGQGRFPLTTELIDDTWIKNNLKRLDLDAIQAPGGTTNSIREANNTVWNPSKDVIPLPTATTYVYQPRTAIDGLCKNVGDKCVNFSLFYYKESTNEIIRTSSHNQ